MEDLVRRACQAEAGIEIGASLAALPRSSDGRAALDADVLIAGVTDGGDSELPLAVLETRPAARVLLIEVHDAVGELFELRPRRTRLGALTPKEIVHAVLDDRAHASAWNELGAHRREAT
jgi:hypothetical protein